VDLATVTPKLLKRCKRDELVRMCEARELPVEGNKSQLVDTLIKWRNHQPPPTAPSSTGTVRPTSAVRAASPGRRRSNRTSRGDKTPVPILLRTHVHVHQPNTPPVSGPTTAKPGTKEGEDGEVELDLVGLGLVDREIPCDRITKLEKIGSGGFKDVFIGKFKGKKVAIAEFRGTLTQSMHTHTTRRWATLTILSGHQRAQASR
jgi:mitogen-activated protein kinase kinase kinase 13